MNAKSASTCLLGLVCAAAHLAAGETETIAYFPLDANPYSTVNADRNPPSVTTLLEPGYASHEIAYDSNVKGATVCDRTGLLRENNIGCLKLAWARMSIDMDLFPLSNDVDTVTIEMFVKGQGLGNYFPVFALAPFNNASELGGNVTLQNPQLNVVPCGNGAIYAYVAAGTSSQIIFGNGNLLDDDWHHVAMVLQPNESGGTTATWYRDYAKVLEKNSAEKWTGAAGLKSDSFKLVLGSRRGTVYLDEIKITKGVLPQDRWMRQYPSPPPVDGDTLLYLPFDGDTSTICHALDCPEASWSGGAAVFVDDIGSRRSLRDGEKVVVRQSNLSSLSCNRIRYYWAPNYWAFQSNTCQSATIEFFYKGSANPEDVPNTIPMFRIGNDAKSLRLSLMAYSSEPQQMDHRAYISVRDMTNINDGDHAAGVVCGRNGVMCDDRWHHVAMTTETTDNGTKGQIKLYWDYELVKTATLAAPWCAVDPDLSSDSFNLGSTSCVCSLDELRITKGVLPPEKFLRKFSDGGMLLIYR